MLIFLENLIPAPDLARMRTLIEQAEFVDGRVTVKEEGLGIKENEQMAPGPQMQEINGLILKALDASDLFKKAAAPKVIRPFMVSRTGVGGSYGVHMDSVMMGPQQQRMRTDVAMTIFLNDPSEYDGGELVLNELNSERKIKLSAGSAVFYPPVMLHQVAPVTRGHRLAAITWIHSLIRRHHHREILYDLDVTRQALYEQSGRTPEFERLTKTYLNLMREWIEP